MACGAESGHSEGLGYLSRYDDRNCVSSQYAYHVKSQNWFDRQIDLAGLVSLGMLD